MAYTPFHADWHDSPTADTPITAAALEYIEAGIVAAAAGADAAVAKALLDAKGDLIVATGADTPAKLTVGSNDTVPVAASGDSKGIVWQKIGNAQVASNAAIAASKLAGFPNDAAKYLAGDGSWPTSAKVVSYGTTLPGSPADGDEAILVDSTSAPTYQWRFRYNAGAAGANKWEFVGGAPQVSRVGGINQATTASVVDLSGGPSVTVPRAGDYLVRYGAVITGAPSAFIAQMTDNTGVGAAVWAFGTSASSISWHVSDEGVRALAASAVVKLRIQRTTGADNTFNFVNVRVVVTPMRVA